MKADLIYSSNCDLGEGPIWHKGLLWWVDIESGRLLNSANETFSAPRSIGAAVPCESGRWLLAEEEGLSFWDLTNEPELFWRRPSASPAYRFNDAKVGPAGTLVAGSLKRGTLDGNCAYYQLNTNGEVKEIISNVALCNGLDWSPDGKIFYFADTGERCVYSCPVDTWGKGNVLFQPETGYPDGMCIDTDGHIWVAIWSASVVVRVDGKTGKELARIEVPVPHVSSCCFGGEDLRTLFITTARTGLEPEALERYPESGSVFQCVPGAKGLETKIFNDGEIK